jgi:hypothetical protein
MERTNVEGLIACGDMSTLHLPNEWFVSENEPNTFDNRFVFEMEAHQNIEYFYLFNKDDKWECQSSEMISIEEFK